MSTEELEPLSREVEELVEADRTLSTLPEGVRQRVMRRVEWTLAAGPVGGQSAPEDVDGGGRGAGADHGPMAQSTAATTMAAAGLTKTVVVGVVTFALGAATGAGIHASVTSRNPPPVTSQQSETDSIPTEPTATLSAQLSPMVSVPSRSTTKLPSARPPTQPLASADEPAPERDKDLAAERALLVEARKALSAGNPVGALGAVDKHAARFPSGRLSQEREVIAIRALASAGRVDEARARARRFKGSYPRSMALPAIEELFGTNP